MREKNSKTGFEYVTIAAMIVVLMLLLLLVAHSADGPQVSIGQGPARTTLYFYDGSSNLEYICEAVPSQPEGVFSIDGGTLTGIVDATNTATVTTVAAHGRRIGNQVTVSGVTYTIADAAPSIVVLTNTATATSVAHGLGLGAGFVLSGATVDTDLNGAYVVATVPTADTFTFTTSSVADATYVETTIEFAVGDADLAGDFIVLTVPSPTTFTFATAGVADVAYNSTGVQVVADAPDSTEAIWSVQRLHYDVSANLTAIHWAGGNEARDNVCGDRATLEYK